MNAAEPPAGSRAARILTAAALALAPVLYAASTLTWRENGTYGVTGAVWMAGSLVCWLHGLSALYGLLAARWPLFAAAGRLVLAAGVAGGTAFAVRGFYDGALGHTREASIQVLEDHPVASQLLFFLPGPLFPASLVLLGVALAKARLVHPALGLALAATGVVFPVTTVLRVQPGATALSVVMIAVFGRLAHLYATGRTRGLRPMTDEV